MAVEVMRDPSVGKLTEIKFSDVSVPSGAATDLCAVTVPAGSWTVLCQVGFATNATGYREVRFSSASKGRASSSIGERSPAVSGNATVLRHPSLVSVGKATKYYVTGYQTSGSELSASGWVKIMRTA